ncbi:hypothetical protein Tco_1447260 [Tanacetum coccineum]
MDEVIPYEKIEETHKKMISKNNEAKMVLYNALPKKEYEITFMCKTVKDVWNSLIITHQGNKKVKDNKIDLFVQNYEEFVISDDETIDCAFARFNTIIISLKALDKSFSSRNHVRKFLRSLPTKWSPKVNAIEESKDLSTLHLDKLIRNLKVYEVVLEKGSETSKVKKEKYKSLALKARKVSSDEDESCSGSDEEKRRREKRIKGFKCGDPNHFISDCPKHSFNDQKASVGGCWSESDEEDESKRDEICLMALDNIEVCLKVKLEPDEWIKDSGCSRHMTGNKDLFSTYEAINGGNVVFGSNTKSKIIGKDYPTKFDPKSIEGVFLGYSPNSKAYIILNKETMRINESLNVRFEESPPLKSSTLVDDDDTIESQIIENQIKDDEDKENGPLNKEIVNIKESKDHPIEKVIGNLNERTLRSQV